jgi:hypothetical protein
MNKTTFYGTGTSGNIIDYQLSFSTADIQNQVFEGDASPIYFAPELPGPEGEYRLIGDEIMRLDRENLPPFLKKDAFGLEKSEKK